MMQQQTANSYLFGGNAPYVEELYEAYLDNPGSVPDNWRAYFDSMQNVPAVDGSNKPDVAHASVIASFAERAKQGPIRVVTASADAEMGRKRVAVTQLIATYRYLGSQWANLDPLQRQERPTIPELEPAFYGFTDADMDIQFNISNTYFGQETASLRDLLNFLRDTYCRSIGAEFMYISDPAEKRWLQEKLESIRSTPNFIGREEDPHPRPPDRGRRPGALPAHQIRRPEALLARRLRVVHRLDRRNHPARRRKRRAGNRHRHGPPRPPERAGQHPRQIAGRPVRRIRRQARRRTAVGRRQVPPGLLERYLDRRRPGPPVARVQSVAPRDRQPGRRRFGQGAHGPPRRQGRRASAADPGARRRRIRRPGRGHGNAEPGADPRLRHRRHGAHRDQQPDRLHHLRPARRAFDAVLLGRGQDDRSAGPAHQRRRSGSGRAGDPDRDGLPRAVQEGHRPRHHLLPQAGPQRAGHPGADPAADVQEDRPASGHPQAVRGQAGRAGHHSGRRRRQDGRRLPRRDGRRQAHGRSGHLELQEQVRGRLAAVPEQEVDRQRRHRRADDRTETPGAAHHHRAGRLQGPLAGRKSAGRPRHHGPRRNEPRLGHGRAPRLRFAGRRPATRSA